jgi:hypothetical protein
LEWPWRTDDQTVRAGAGDDLEQRSRIGRPVGPPVDHRLGDRDAGYELCGEVMAFEDRLKPQVGGGVADEQAALTRTLAVDEPAGRATPEHGAHDERDSQQERLILACLSADEQVVAEPGTEHEQRPELPEPRELLDGRLADSLVVALIEAEDLGRRDDGRRQQYRERRQRVCGGEGDRCQQGEGQRANVT